MSETEGMSLQKELNMPMDWERGRTSEMVVEEEDVRVACWSLFAILSGSWGCLAETTDVRARSESRGTEDQSRGYMVLRWTVVWVGVALRVGKVGSCNADNR